MDITIEFTSKNHSRTHRTLMCLLLLPYMVTPITKRTSPLNSHQKPVQNIYNTYGFASIAIYGHSDHKTNITIEFTTQNIYNTYGFAAIAIYGHSDHKTNITIEFTSKNLSRAHRTLMCLLLLPYTVQFRIVRHPYVTV